MHKQHRQTKPHVLILTSYRDIVECTTGMCCPNIFSVRISNNGAILTAAIGHQVLHVALPRHIQEIDAIYKKIPKSFGRMVAEQDTPKSEEDLQTNLESPI